MQLESTFSVVAPINDVWETLMDVERVAGCVPGAQVLNKLSEDAYQVGLKVKLGPMSMQYRGQLIVVERDAMAHRAVFEGKAQETRGQGTAQGTATLVLVESAGTTTGTVSADFDLAGKVAAMGMSVVGGVTDQMMALFAENLQNMVGESREDIARQTPADMPSARPSRPASSTNESPDTSLNAVALATGMIMDWLTPAKLLGLLAVVASVAYRLGRRAASRTVS